MIKNILNTNITVQAFSHLSGFRYDALARFICIFAICMGFSAESTYAQRTYSFDGSTPVEDAPPSPDTPSTIGHFKEVLKTPHVDKLAMTDVTVDFKKPSLTIHFHHPRAYKIYRRVMFSPKAWTPVGSVSESERQWEDANVRAGVPYEYKLEHVGVGSPHEGETLATYLSGGVDVDQTNYRGRMILLIAKDVSQALPAEVDRLKSDLTGDGWYVQTVEVDPDTDWYGDEASINIRTELQSIYKKAPANDKPQLLYILGSVPAPWSGLFTTSKEMDLFYYTPDGHKNHNGAVPTDTYYADLDGVWTDEGTYETHRQNNAPGDKRWDQMGIPSDVEMGVGRVDLRELPCYEPATEMDLLRRYLDKAHALRMHERDFGRRCLHMMVHSKNGNLSADELALRTFTSIFGLNHYEFTKTLYKHENTADYVNDKAAKGEEPFFFAARTSGGGYYPGAKGYASQDFVDFGSRAAIWFGYQSYYWDWASKDNLMRAQIAAEGNSVGAFSVAHSGWFFHHMGLGYPIGLSIKSSFNNDDEKGPYTDWESAAPRNFSGRVHMGYMGDPAVRPFQVSPVTDLSTSKRGRYVNLSWKASADASEGYHVYRSTTGKHGQYEKLTQKPVSAGVTDGVVNYTDATVAAGEVYYMVRAVKRELTGAGSFLNASTGLIVKGF